jgi:hypothetical protein
MHRAPTILHSTFLVIRYQPWYFDITHAKWRAFWEWYVKWQVEGLGPTSFDGLGEASDKTMIHVWIVMVQKATWILWLEKTSHHQTHEMPRLQDLEMKQILFKESTSLEGPNPAAMTRKHLPMQTHKLTCQMYSHNLCPLRPLPT